MREGKMTPEKLREELRRHRVPGWYSLTDKLAEDIVRLLKPEELVLVRVTDCKSKYGRLSVNTLHAVAAEREDEFEDLIDTAELASEFTCEKCGSRKTAWTRSFLGWAITLCDVCSAGKTLDPEWPCRADQFGFRALDDGTVIDLALTHMRQPFASLRQYKGWRRIGYELVKEIADGVPRVELINMEIGAALIGHGRLRIIFDEWLDDPTLSLKVREAVADAIEKSKRTCPKRGEPGLPVSDGLPYCGSCKHECD